MRSHRLSASALHRARHCLYFARLDAEWGPYESSQDALTGTATHACAEASIEGRECDPLVVADELGCDGAHAEKVERLVTQWRQWWRTARGTLTWSAERPIAYDVKTRQSRWLAKTGRRDYSTLGPNEIPATIDADAIDKDAVVVMDLKTGRQSGLEPARSNIQIGMAAVAMASLMGRTRARVMLAKVDEEYVYCDDAELGPFDLSLIADELEDMVARVPDAEPVPGAWCGYCPARQSCPSTLATVDATLADVVPSTALVRRPKIALEIADNAHAAEMLTAIDTVETFLDAAKKKLREYADTNDGIRFADGSVYRKTTIDRRSVDLSDPAIVAWLHANELREAVECSTTLVALKRAGASKDAMATLEKMGAIKRTSFPRYETKPPLVAGAKKTRAA